MTDSVELTPDVISRLTADSEPWLSCDDCFEQVDVSVDTLLESAIPLTEAFRTHLLCCPACHEEARSLAALVASEHSLSAAEALDRLDAAVARTGS